MGGRETKKWLDAGGTEDGRWEVGWDRTVPTTEWGHWNALGDRPSVLGDLGAQPVGL